MLTQVINLAHAPLSHLNVHTEQLVSRLCTAYQSQRVLNNNPVQLSFTGLANVLAYEAIRYKDFALALLSITTSTRDYSASIEQLDFSVLELCLLIYDVVEKSKQIALTQNTPLIISCTLLAQSFLLTDRRGYYVAPGILPPALKNLNPNSNLCYPPSIEFAAQVDLHTLGLLTNAWCTLTRS